MADSYENTKMPERPDTEPQPDMIPVDDKGQPLPDPSEFLGSYIEPKSLVELQRTYEAAEEDETIKDTMEPVQATGFFRKHRPGRRGYDYYGTPSGSIPNDSNGLKESPLSKHFTAAEAIDPEFVEDENGEEIPFVQEEPQVVMGKIMTPEQKAFQPADEEIEGYNKLMNSKDEIFTKTEVKRDKDAPRIMDLYKDSMNTKVIYQAGTEEDSSLGSLSQEEAKELFTEPKKLSKTKSRIKAKEEKKALKAKIKLEKKKAKEKRKAEKAAAKARKKAQKAAAKGKAPVPEEPKPVKDTTKDDEKEALKLKHQEEQRKAKEKDEQRRKEQEDRRRKEQEELNRKREEEKRLEQLRQEALKTVEEAKAQLEKEKEELLRTQQEKMKEQESMHIETRKQLEEEKSAAQKAEEEAKKAREEAEKMKAELERMKLQAENALKQKKEAEESALAEKKERERLEEQVRRNNEAERQRREAEKRRQRERENNNRNNYNRQQNNHQHGNQGNGQYNHNSPAQKSNSETTQDIKRRLAEMTSKLDNQQESSVD